LKCGNSSLSESRSYPELTLGTALNDRGRPFLPDVLEKAFGEAATPLEVASGGVSGGLLPPGDEP
jgi:hypothetical protein